MNMSQSEWEASIQRVGVVVGSLVKRDGKILEVVWQTFDEIAEHEKAGRMRAPWVFDVISKLESHP